MNKILLKYYLHEIISFNHDHYLEYNVENYSILAYSNPYCTLAPAVLKSDDFNISLAPAVLKSDDKNSFYQRKLFFISKMLDKISKIGDNIVTTKQIAVKPNRHTLAIFMPTANSSTTGINIMSLSCTDKVHSDYGGLIEPNTIPLVGNKFSRLFAVVETCHPICEVVSLTKQIGAFSC